jgi:methyl-accepting chemotaxis protein
MEEGKTRLQHAETSIEQILHNIHTIAGDIRQIAAGNDEQSSTLQSFGQTITGFAGSAENTLSFARDAGQGIYRISEELIDLRQKRIQLASGLSLKQLLEIYKTDHLCWTWKIYNMLLGYETLNASDLETSDTCELGKLLHNKGWHTKGDTKQFVSVHDQVHTLYKEAVAAHLNKNYSQINVIWDQLLTATNRLTFEIDKIIRECTD